MGLKSVADNYVELTNFCPVPSTPSMHGCKIADCHQQA